MDPQTVEAVAAQTGLTKDEVDKVAAALNELQSDPPVGRVIHRPENGDVAVRVRQYGETYWRVTSTDDRTWIEADLVGWDVLLDPAKAETLTPDK
jgi:hypothetical protein